MMGLKSENMVPATLISLLKKIMPGFLNQCQLKEVKNKYPGILEKGGF